MALSCTFFKIQPTWYTYDLDMTFKVTQEDNGTKWNLMTSSTL